MVEMLRGRRLPAELVARCHANAIEDYRAFARTTEGGEIHEGPGRVFISTSGVNSLENPAFFTATPDDPATALREARAFFDGHGVPWSAILLPEVREAMAPSLAGAGFRDEGKFPGMILRPIPDEAVRLPDGLTVERVENEEQLDALEHAAALAYDTPYGGGDPRWLDYPGLSLYLGSWKGKPVAHGVLVAAFGIAGVAYIGTVPDARHRGFAQAIVRTIVAEGRSHGCDAAYLWATPIGRAVYAKMGFERILDYEIWSAPGFPLPSAIRPG
jgi:GNAT superfamily N-acetyltransferase